MKKCESIVGHLCTEKEELEKIIEQIQNRLKDAPEGCVRLAKHKEGVQFYRRLDPKDINGVYIPADERKLAITLIQKKYDQQLLRTAEKQMNAINRFLQKYDPEALEKVYLSTGIKRRKYLFVAELPDEIFAENWQQISYTPKNITEGTPEHFTQKNERVRSKSEVMIANALYREGIPYRYECPLTLGNQLIHPDFTILRIRDRTEVYWEHFGLLDDTAYRNDGMERVDLYEKNGLFPGDRLIITAESFKRPLNLSSINRLIRHYFR